LVLTALWNEGGDVVWKAARAMSVCEDRGLDPELDILYRAEVRDR
jgi:hypothetical protein